MKKTTADSDIAVTLQQVLDRREARSERQRELIERWRHTLVCFTMNIPGPIKNNRSILESYNAGREAFSALLESEKIAVLYTESIVCVTGCEAFLVLDCEAVRAKKLSVDLELRHPLGRLFDFDVFDSDGDQLDRASVGAAERGCLVCGVPGRACASRRLHTAEEAYRAAEELMGSYLRGRCRSQVSAMCCRAMLYETATAPKPGLVTRLDNGSHTDMDVFTFIDSSTALLQYWRDAVGLGQSSAPDAPEQCFKELRVLGIAAEREMLSATGGVNTHKGAVFLLGTICAAIGRLSRDGIQCTDAELIFAECSRMAASAVQAEFEEIRQRPAKTKGERFYQEYGIVGVRGEVANGLRSVSELGLPALKRSVAAGKSLEEAGSAAIMELIAAVRDTSLIARGGVKLQAEAAERAKKYLSASEGMQNYAALESWFVENRLSPGGCADLLAASYLMLFLESGAV